MTLFDMLLSAEAPVTTLRNGAIDLSRVNALFLTRSTYALPTSSSLVRLSMILRNDPGEDLSARSQRSLNRWNWPLNAASLFKWSYSPFSLGPASSGTGFLEVCLEVSLEVSLEESDCLQG